MNTLHTLPQDQFLTLGQATKYFPSPMSRMGRLNVKTIWRYIRRGYRGVYLQHSRVGHILFVTPRMILKFMEESKKLRPSKTRKYWKVLQDAGVSLDNWGV